MAAKNEKGLDASVFAEDINGLVAVQTRIIS